MAPDSGRGALGLSEPPVPMARKDPQQVHLPYRNWRLETSSAVLEMGVSTNQKWEPPQYFWMKGRDWIIRQAVKHLTAKALAEALRQEETTGQSTPAPRASHSQPAQRPEHVEAPPTYEEVMETRRPCGTPKPAPYIDEWLIWGKGASIRAGQGRGHVERHHQQGGKGKQGGLATSWVGKGQVSQAHNQHRYQSAPARLPSPPLLPPPYTQRRHPLQEQGQKGAPNGRKGGQWGR